MYEHLLGERKQKEDSDYCTRRTFFGFPQYQKGQYGKSKLFPKVLEFKSQA